MSPDYHFHESQSPTLHKTFDTSSFETVQYSYFPSLNISYLRSPVPRCNECCLSSLIVYWKFPKTLKFHRSYSSQTLYPLQIKFSNLNNFDTKCLRARYWYSCLYLNFKIIKNLYLNVMSTITNNINATNVVELD